MKIFGYKKISRLIMVTTILLILFNTIAISLFYYKNQLIVYQQNLLILKYENIKEQKQNIKNDIHKIVEMINYKYNDNKTNIIENKNDIKEWISSIKFDKSKSDYIFVYELIDKNGGDSFAKMTINPNRPDIVGKYISTKYKDINGFEFRKKFLDDINKYGESIVKYNYKKTNNKIGEKISYFYYFKPLNWIISKGIYIEDIQDDIANQKLALEQMVQKQINQNLIFFIFFSVVASIFAYIIGKKIEKTINNKNKKVKSTTKALSTLNKELDTKVKQEVEKNKEKEKILMQRSKFIALGEMISLIAHQWRQPIGELNAIVMNIKLHFDLGKLDKNLMDNKVKGMENLLEYMSHTIDDFRGFFKPNKQKEKFFFCDSCKRIKEISSAMLSGHGIKLIEKIDETLFLVSYKNEFEQVVLNIITNAKDALLRDNIEEPTITVIVKKSDKIYIKICDNANGIDKDSIDKIFEPYFTTKEESEGTGIGLYMSKMIIEQNMGGKLEVKSSLSGACFIISFEV